MNINELLENYLQDKLSALMLNSTFNPVVYDEINYKYESNDDEITCIFSGGAIIQTDVSLPIYQEAFVLNARTEKNGFDATNNMLNDLFIALNNSWVKLGAYECRLVLNAPVVMNPYTATQDGITNTLYLRGTIYFSSGTIETNPTYFINGTKVAVIDPIIEVDKKGQEENSSGVGKSTSDYKMLMIKFSLPLTRDAVVQDLYNETINTESDYSFKEETIEGWTIIGNPTLSEPISFENTIKPLFDAYYTNHTLDTYKGLVLKISAGGYIDGSSTIELYNQNGIRAYSWSGTNQVVCLNKEGTKYQLYQYDYSGIKEWTNLFAAQVVKATDTEKGLATLNVILQRKA